MQLNKKSVSVVGIASKDKARSLLTHVRITPEFTEATDGFRLVRVTNPPLLDGLDAGDGIGPFTECLVSGNAVKEVKGEKDVLADYDGNHVVFYPGLNREDVPYTVRAQVAEDLKWPETELLFPSDQPAYRVFVNPYMLLGICKIAAQFGDMMVMEFRGERGSIYLETTDNEQTMKALIQPIKPPDSSSSEDAAPKKVYPMKKGRKRKGVK
jgi:hypothetical protein